MRPSGPPWTCIYTLNYNEWLFVLTIQNISPDSRVVTLTASLNTEVCTITGISSGRVFTWQQTYTVPNLSNMLCAASYDLPILGDAFGCYCLESFLHLGPTITVSAMTSV